VDVLPRAEIARSNARQHWYELANGSRIWLFGLDPDPITRIPSKVGSVELGWAFVDEAAECSLADWVMVKGRLSWPGIGYHQITAATNPAAPGHWLKRRFTPPSPSRVYLHASTFDNPALAADYVAEAAASPDDHYHRRYHLGLWVAAEGQIWQLPDDRLRERDGWRSFRSAVASIWRIRSRVTGRARPRGRSGPIRTFQGIGYLLDSHWTAETEGGLGEEPDPVTGATTEPGAETDPEPVEVGRPED
jgi:hypothetical protein